MSETVSEVHGGATGFNVPLPRVAASISQHSLTTRYDAKCAPPLFLLRSTIIAITGVITINGSAHTDDT